MKKIAILCCAKNSVYKAMDGLDCYDIERDAHTFTGGAAIVAHPPCRPWSAYCSHQAHTNLGEWELGLWCVDQLFRWGGILEQPAHSRLWDAAGLPKPGWTHTDKLWACEVSQSWWGDSREKSTWLCFFKIHPLAVTFPLHLRASTNGDRRRWQLMNTKSRSATPPAFAEWLVDTARMVA